MKKFKERHLRCYLVKQENNLILCHLSSEILYIAVLSQNTHIENALRRDCLPRRYFYDI